MALRITTMSLATATCWLWQNNSQRTVLDRVEEVADAVILRFFFDFNDTTKQELDGMLRYATVVRSATLRGCS